ncbi:MAG: alpha/beta hydrolase [Chitinophagaceae bacterium]|nr:alpha/beta hydrolase [Chitinophagaceae bacterium]
MKVYFISGLGADETAFSKLSLPGIEKVHLNWLVPEKKESIEAYAGRMAARITEPGPVIVGLSFGGMMAIEIAKLIPVKKLILLSSAKHRKELPSYFSVCRYIPLHRWLPLNKMASNRRIMNLVLGARTREQRERLKKVIDNTIEGFNEWAIDQVINWKNTEPPANASHIHGDADRLLPLRYVRADYIIKNGGHLMVVNQAKEVSALLQKLIPLY